MQTNVICSHCLLSVVGWDVDSFLIDNSTLLETLVQNFSVPAQDVNTVLNARINFTEVRLVIVPCVWIYL